MKQNLLQQAPRAGSNADTTMAFLRFGYLPRSASYPRLQLPVHPGHDQGIALLWERMQEGCPWLTLVSWSCCCRYPTCRVPFWPQSNPGLSQLSVWGYQCFLVLQQGMQLRKGCPLTEVPAVTPKNCFCVTHSYWQFLYWCPEEASACFLSPSGRNKHCLPPKKISPSWRGRREGCL